MSNTNELNSIRFTFGSFFLETVLKVPYVSHFSKSFVSLFWMMQLPGHVIKNESHPGCYSEEKPPFTSVSVNF